MAARIVNYWNQKGGVGKTTVCAHHAFSLAESGNSVLVVDTDPQGDLSSTLLGGEFKEAFSDCLGASLMYGINEQPIDLQKLAKSPTEGITVMYSDDDLILADDLSLDEMLDSFKDKANQLKQEFDYIIIDSPPTIGKKIIASLYGSTDVIAPVEARKFSMDGLGKLLETVSVVKEENEDLNFLGVLVNRVNSRSKNQREAIELLQEHLGKDVFLTHLVEREAISDAIEQGLPIWQLGKSGAVNTASKEMKAVLKEINRRIQYGG